MNLTAELLRSILMYDEKTGVFRWRATRSNRAKKVALAGSFSRGYVWIRINGKLYAAHQLAWLYVTGEPAHSQIDHIDGVRHNNRFSNLRKASYELNAQNLRTARVTSKTGLLGVYLCKQTGRYRARIRANGVVHHLGRHATAEEAYAVYVEAKRKLHEGNTL